ncbi:CAP domain-containing protein [Deinococcus sp. VB343]|uniref:CAP domain-containing protein n=1 Tax=Deinococcus sp. VB343 TaxID=3385567 RepID=UPI0039C9A52D
MTTKLLPLLALPILFLASCGGPSTPTAPSAVGSNITSALPTPVNTIKDAGSQSRSSEEQAVFEQLNAARATGRTCGSKFMPAAPAVTWNGYLAAAAKTHAEDMAAKGYFGHKSPDGRTPSMRAEAAGYTGWTEIGENIAAGYTVRDVIQGWLDSPSHCETLMDPALKEVGMSYVYKPGSKFGTYWVQDFGTR